MILVRPELIAQTMDLKPTCNTLADLADRVEQGLPKSSLKASVAHVYLDTENRRRLAGRLVPEATFKRRKTQLSPEESERVERVARIFATVQFVFDSDNDARAFLSVDHPLLKGRKPIDLALTELGARQVEDLLWKLFYGIGA